ncbi:hypothetical protein [Pontibacter akesuensis]|uniref:Phospholipase_D-nuclease N-terminal n=2 Tax=Pontibacter akesuensis TaxID=388950 RepID=A0A1I7KH72_9BACT|nr:hypothetical protein [Pontibacter akesuensis]GHA79065.1 hypothetical protein GCM10007389_36470 [Pontibacter akesuensis]SFU96780.1 hypothetical protein SAMN04487941_3741 [Pontibacter akesuensis]
MELMMIDITNLLFLTVIGLYVVLLGMILTYVYYDAEMRGMNGWVITALAFFAGTALGTLIWIALRPKLKPIPIPVKS